MQNIKARFWTFVLYPDSAPEDWTDRIIMTGLPFFVSPIHDKDLNSDGSPKKPHYHVCIIYHGPTTFSNVQKTITDPLNQPHPQFVNSVKGIYRYFSHADNPEKAQYNPSDIKHFNGFQCEDYFAFTISEEDRLYNDIENLILENNITEFFQAIVFLKSNGELQLLSFFRRHTIYFKEFINSIRYCRHDNFGGIV